MSHRTFITGFGPFGSFTQNPSETLARGSGRPFQILEVGYSTVDSFLDSIDTYSFERLLMMGVSEHAQCFRLEMVGRNQTGCSPDVFGRALTDPYIDPSGPAALPSTLWKPEHAEDLKGMAMLSEDAGSYLCNYAFYRALQELPHRRVGFLHVPSHDTIGEKDQAEFLKHLLDLIEAKEDRSAR